MPFQDVVIKENISSILQGLASTNIFLIFFCLEAISLIARIDYTTDVKNITHAFDSLEDIFKLLTIPDIKT